MLGILITFFFLPFCYFLNINLPHSNDDSQLNASLDTISKSTDDLNILYVKENITVASVHYIRKNLTIMLI